jgi:GTP-binding protein LepA
MRCTEPDGSYKYDCTNLLNQANLAECQNLIEEEFQHIGIDPDPAGAGDLATEEPQCGYADLESVVKVSGKTGENVPLLLDEVIKRVPAPDGATASKNNSPLRSLIFDFQYSNHTGVIVFVRVIDGEVRKHDKLIFKVAGREFEAIEVGIFAPDNRPVDVLASGEIGYIVTGIKEPGIASVGDTVSAVRDTLPPLPGYQSPRPVVWASLYPESQDDLPLLRQALGRLQLSDSFE